MLDPMRSYIILALTLAALPVFLAQARADSLQDFTRDLQRSPVTINAKTAVDGTTFIDQKANIYALAGLDVPDALVPDAQKRLAELTDKKNCTLFTTLKADKGRTNRMGQTLGQYECGNDNIWLQADLLMKGFARVRTTPENPELATQMLKIEDIARGKKSGLWDKAEYAVLTPESAGQHLNGFEIVAGTVYAVAQTKDMIYLNFARDWKTDFTIGIPNKLRRDFSMAHINPQSLRGQDVRVRGWLRDYNGPFIELDHIQQLEILGDRKADMNLPAGVSGGSVKGMQSIKTPTPPKVEKPAAPTEQKKPAPKIFNLN